MKYNVRAAIFTISFTFLAYAMEPASADNDFEIIEDQSLVAQCKAVEAHLNGLMTKINARLEGDMSAHFDSHTDLNLDHTKALSIHAKNTLSAARFVYSVDLNDITFLYEMHDAITKKIEDCAPETQQNQYPKLMAILEQKFNGLLIHREAETNTALIAFLLSEKPISYNEFNTLLLNAFNQCNQ